MKKGSIPFLDVLIGLALLMGAIAIIVYMSGSWTAVLSKIFPFLFKP